MEQIINRITEKGYTKGICCGEGWYPLLKDLDEKLAYLYPDYKIQQVKEKFGTLRFYCSFGETEGIKLQIAEDLVNQAESRSSYTCEDCGAAKYGRISKGGYKNVELRNNGWYMTLCDDCNEVRLKAKSE